MTSNRYSRADKGKWVSDSSRPHRKAPLQIHNSVNADLIAEHSLTLIGRVTNPSIQKTRALVDFFLQHWHVVGSITGRDLGPNLFQFQFETEHDLLSVLNKAPFHFKKWMLILQRWEPIVSDNFPAYIPFWITIHGIPLHHWTEQTISTIGSDLGKVVDKDVDRGRVRVLINGLRPLEMEMEVNLSGELKRVEFQYEKLEKHCFLCHSLSHEKSDCPVQRTLHTLPPARPSISQTRTLERLDEDRRRQDDRRSSRNTARSERYPPPPHTDHRGSSRLGNRDRDWNKEASNPQGSLRHYDNVYGRRQGEPNGEASRSQIQGRSPSIHTSTGTHRTHDSRYQGASPRSTWRQIPRQEVGNLASHSAHSQVSHTPSPKPHREAMTGPGANYNPEGDTRSSGRRSALERLSGSAERVPLLANGVANSNSGRLQEVDIQYLEEIMSPQTTERVTIPSTSKKALTLTSPSSLGEQAISPIRTLSEDRLHVSLRLGPCINSPSPQPPVLSAKEKKAAAAAAKAAGKKKVTSPPTRKRVARTPALAGNAKRRRVTKTQSSPRRNSPRKTSPRRKGLTLPTGEGQAAASLPAGVQPKTTLIPAIKKRGSGFRTDPNSLP
ncbi:Uncharacterized protein Rs2_45444 [Raphanus sativus]|nr:Uncharacterized protein Rs2_45444 [Raphanus sativus]